MARPSFALLALALTACYEPAYVYRPAEQVTATVRGEPAARYQIPPESPKGDVRVASFGVTKMELRGDSGTQEVPMLHLRMVISNESDQPWRVDARQLTVAFRNGPVNRPAYVNSDQAQGTPELEVAPRGQRIVDLYYPLPPAARGARDVPEFDFTWQVRTAERLVAERTPFERLEIETPPYYYNYGPSAGWVAGTGWYGSRYGYWGGPLGWGPGWWYDPVYSGVILRARTPVIIHGGYPRGIYGYPRGVYAPPAGVHVPPPAMHAPPPAIQSAPPGNVHVPPPGGHR